MSIFEVVRKKELKSSKHPVTSCTEECVYLGVVQEKVQLHADLVDVIEGASGDPLPHGLRLSALDVNLIKGAKRDQF